MAMQDNLNRFGLVALATDLTIEGDAARLMPQGTRLHVTRIAFDNPTTEANLRATGPRIADAMDLLVPGIPLSGIGFGCTSAAAVLGDAVAEAARGRAPVSSPAEAALRGMRALRVGRVSLMTPYLAATTELVADWLTRHGIAVLRRASMGHADDRDMARLSPAEVTEMAIAADHPDAQALFLSCTALPALGLIDDLERRLGKPVISANQALFWAMLDRVRIPAAGPGALFRARTW
ncbi:ectoine utilization protein EutA [Paracoccus aestuarii]|uniref:Ectoine utilization protein EutA n=2 Tax=root TaxID=1 RepID=A0A418ZYQ6_9RHOB|nr:aspartate/glutamate racemase family protein [Paracoccus aestuarii]RJL05638.1 ectoine utilization protein EutA [Paracoccus aestuarii]